MNDFHFMTYVKFAFELILSPTSRMYWVFIVSGLLMVFIADYVSRRRGMLPRGSLIDSRSWLSKSARNDYIILIGNAIFIFLVIQSLFPSANDIVKLFPIGNPGPSATSVFVGVLFALVLFIADDFVRFIVHYSEHKFAILWEFHKVHHSATHLNFITAERNHPVSILLFQIPSLVAVVLVNVAFIALFGQKVEVFVFLGGNVFWITANIFGGILRHSPVWISFGPAVEKWVISPAQHQIHHSSSEVHFDRNFGSSLAIWDRIFGTLYITKYEREKFEFGLGDENPNYDTARKLYLTPLTSVASLFNAKRKDRSRR